MTKPEPRKENPMNTDRRFRVNIACDNAAFDPNPRAEIARILREIAKRVENGDDIMTYRNAYDINGNTVGTFALKDFYDNILQEAV
jgi:hypothetical protein